MFNEIDKVLGDLKKLNNVSDFVEQNGFNDRSVDELFEKIYQLSQELKQNRHNKEIYQDSSIDDLYCHFRCVWGDNLRRQLLCILIKKMQKKRLFESLLNLLDKKHKYFDDFTIKKARLINKLFAKNNITSMEKTIDLLHKITEGHAQAGLNRYLIIKIISKYVNNDYYVCDTLAIKALIFFKNVERIRNNLNDKDNAHNSFSTIVLEQRDIKKIGCRYSYEGHNTRMFYNKTSHKSCLQIVEAIINFISNNYDDQFNKMFLKLSELASYFIEYLYLTHIEKENLLAKLNVMAKKNRETLYYNECIIPYLKKYRSIARLLFAKIFVRILEVCFLNKKTALKQLESLFEKSIQKNLCKKSFKHISLEMQQKEFILELISKTLELCSGIVCSCQDYFSLLRILPQKICDADEVFIHVVIEITNKIIQIKGADDSMIELIIFLSRNDLCDIEVFQKIRKILSTVILLKDLCNLLDEKILSLYSDFKLKIPGESREYKEQSVRIFKLTNKLFSQQFDEDTPLDSIKDFISKKYKEEYLSMIAISTFNQLDSCEYFLNIIKFRRAQQINDFILRVISTCFSSTMKNELCFEQIVAILLHCVSPKNIVIMEHIAQNLTARFKHEELRIANDRDCKARFINLIMKMQQDCDCKLMNKDILVNNQVYFYSILSSILKEFFWLWSSKKSIIKIHNIHKKFIINLNYIILLEDGFKVFLKKQSSLELFVFKSYKYSEKEDFVKKKISKLGGSRKKYAINIMVHECGYSNVVKNIIVAIKYADYLFLNDYSNIKDIFGLVSVEHIQSYNKEKVLKKMLSYNHIYFIVSKGEDIRSLFKIFPHCPIKYVAFYESLSAVTLGVNRNCYTLNNLIRTNFAACCRLFYYVSVTCKTQLHKLDNEDDFKKIFSGINGINEFLSAFELSEQLTLFIHKKIFFVLDARYGYYKYYIIENTPPKRLTKNKFYVLNKKSLDKHLKFSFSTKHSVTTIEGCIENVAIDAFNISRFNLKEEDESIQKAFTVLLTYLGQLIWRKNYNTELSASKRYVNVDELQQNGLDANIAENICDFIPHN